MAQHIGIVACSAEGAALCYRTICLEGAEQMGPHAHPEVSIHTHCSADYMRHVRADEWEGVAELMLSSADKLSKMGADFLISPDNTIHRAFEFVAERSPLPWLHIVQEVANQAHRSGYKRLGVLGTRYTMEGPVYPQKLAAGGIDHRVPGPKEREHIDQIIMDELVYGQFRPRSLAYFTNVIRGLKDEGCDAVVLGCTEIPLLVTPESSPLPTLDSTRLLARAALRRAVGTTTQSIAI
jgi:aspartate racemase